MKKVLITQPIHEEAIGLFEGRAEVVISPDPSEATIKRLVNDVHGIVVRTTSRITREIITEARQLEVISRTGAGVDNVDVAAASERGIPVCNLPGVNSMSVAEHAVALILGLAKQLRPMDRAVRQGDWAARYGSGRVDLEGKVLGLVGLGRIGMQVADKCRNGFNMQIIAYDPYINQPEVRVGSLKLCDSPEKIFRESDFVSLHVPCNRETHHLVDARLLGLMRSDAYLVNTSRGAVVDEAALIEALRKGNIAGAALDVFEEEPPSIDHPLLAMENVLMTPHSAPLTREGTIRMATGAVKAVLDIFAGREPKHVFNKDALSGKHR